MTCVELAYTFFVILTYLKAVFDVGLRVKESLKKDLSCRHRHLIKIPNNTFNPLYLQ